HISFHFMIAKDKMPYNTVEKEGFTTFVKYKAPLYKIPSRLTTTKLMKNQHDSISLTADIWTVTLNNQSYLGVTSHYIYDDRYKSIVLCVTELAQQHYTACNIRTWLLDITKEWRINKESIMAIVSDNAANIKKAIIDEFGVEKWLSCLAHTLNLILAKLIIKTIVKYFKQSVSAADALRLTSDLMLIQSVDTRWNSEYDMFERFALLSEKVASILLTCPNGPEMLSISELLTVTEFVELLKPFKDSRTIVSGEKYIIKSQAIPVIKNLKIALIHAK
ncbi:hypothetical protein TSAR_005908, partial [Trichomalopsis sarcophagae]